MDTDLDSWNSGDNKPDIIDESVYNPEDVSLEAENGEFVEDEGDEDNLSSENNEDEIKTDEDYEPLDDAEYNDNSFDCD